METARFSKNGESRCKWDGDTIYRISDKEFRPALSWIGSAGLMFCVYPFSLSLMPEKAWWSPVRVNWVEGSVWLSWVWF